MTDYNKYLTRLEKSSSLLVGGALGHVAQNLATKLALSNKHVGKYIARGFNEGATGVVDSSIKGKAVRAFNSAVIPDVQALHDGMHAIGKNMAPHLAPLNPKQKGVLMHAVRKGGVASHHIEDPEIQKVYSHAQNLSQAHLGFRAPDLKDLSADRGKIAELWKSKEHPLLSNVAKHIGVEDVSHAKFKPGSPSAKIGLAASAAMGVADPGVGIIDGLKAGLNSKTLMANKYGKKLSDYFEHKFVKQPAIDAFKNPDKVLAKSKFRHLAEDTIINPLTGSLSRTSAHLAKATESARPQIERSIKDYPSLKERLGALAGSASSAIKTTRNVKTTVDTAKKIGAAVSSAGKSTADHL